jgi:general secretion pathway protein D
MSSQVRATDNGKASVKFGLKVPYVSGSLNSAVATPGAVPYATTQFQQVDVGVNIDMQPHVNGAQDVSMHIKVEVSSVAQQISIAGINEPEISQRVNEADVRLKDSEVSILGGLSDVESTYSLTGVPGLANIPILGNLFGGIKDRTKTDDQVLVALIPHILRAPDLTAVGEQGVYAGTERVIRVQRRPDPDDGQPLPLAPTTPSPAVPAPPNPAQPVAPPVASPPANRPPGQPNP